MLFDLYFSRELRYTNELYFSAGFEYKNELYFSRRLGYKKLTLPAGSFRGQRYYYPKCHRTIQPTDRHWLPKRDERRGNAGARPRLSCCSWRAPWC